MAFIRVENLVINTDHIAAVIFEDCPGIDRLCLVMAVAGLPPIQQTGVLATCEGTRLEFTGEAARSLRDYFSSFERVVDLRIHTPTALPQRKPYSAWYLSDSLVEH